MGITLWEYYSRQADRIEAASLASIETLDDWKRERARRYQEYMHSMGLDPLPDRCDLKVRDYGEFAGPGYVARKLAYQLLDDVWSTGTLYRPDPLPPGKLPAVLYVSGHAGIGTHYLQMHPILWARRGYACLILDTIEQNDNPGDHHEVYFGKRFDLISYGFNAAGGELWNSIRGLDYLVSVPFVDSDRVGVTGISGGGALSFFVGVADERIRATATVAGVDGVVPYVRKRQLDGHCDCMFPYNLYQRDMTDFAALVAPRALLFAFASEDALFERSAYHRMVERVRRIYRLHGVEDKCKLFEYPGPHSYSPEAIRTINDWFDAHVAGKPHPPIELPEIEKDERTTTIFNGAPPEPDRLPQLPEILTKRGTVQLPNDPNEWAVQKKELLARLRRRVLHWLDDQSETLTMQQLGDWIAGARYRSYLGEIGGMEVYAQSRFAPGKTEKLVIGVAGAGDTVRSVAQRLGTTCGECASVLVEPRATGPHEPSDASKVSIIRAGLSVGLTKTLLWIRDVTELVQWARSLPEYRDSRITLYGSGDAGVACVYAAAFDETIASVLAHDIPASHREGAFLPGVLEVLDIQQALGLIAPRPIGLVNSRYVRTTWITRLYERLGCRERLVIGDSLHTVAPPVMELTAAK